MGLFYTFYLIFACKNLFCTLFSLFLVNFKHISLKDGGMCLVLCPYPLLFTQKKTKQNKKTHIKNMRFFAVKNTKII